MFNDRGLRDFIKFTIVVFVTAFLLNLVLFKEFMPIYLAKMYEQIVQEGTSQIHEEEEEVETPIPNDPTEPPDMVEEEPEPIEETIPPINYSDYYTEEDVKLVASVIYGEARGIKSEMERAAVAWCVLNRVDAWGQSIKTVISTPCQFCDVIGSGMGFELAEILAEDVLKRWVNEKNGMEDVGRVLPKEYLYFYGPYNSLSDHFRKSYGAKETWNWELPNPYAS